MSDHSDRLILAPLGGARPPAPAWFDAALAEAPERTTVTVDGAGIEVLTWGRRGDPGLLLLHGFAANADWWSFIAPLLAEGRRVAALSWSGMGRSGWRPAYSMGQYALEALAVAEATGLFEGPQPPVVVGHSYGGFIALVVAETFGERFGGAVTVDSPLSSDARDRPPPQLDEGRHRIYPSLAEALARFRFTPAQPCENLYIADHIARASLHEVEGPDGRGWTWRFDPNLRRRLQYLDLSKLLDAPLCPVAQIFGARSLLMTPDRVAFIRGATPPGTPWIDIPDAGHHVMVDQPLALTAALRGLLAAWPGGQ